MRALGRTGLRVSALGLGAGPLGDLSLDDAAAEKVLHTALALGINVIDTAPSYGASEERIGRALAGRRREVVLVTKGGYGVDGVPDWTPEVLTRGIERALTRLRTDWIDVFLLHSCPLEVLARGDLVEPLNRARAAGKIRAMGYAGDGAALDYAVASGAFDVIECSVNIVDQRALDGAISKAHARGMGVLAKRSLANAAWRSSGDTRPSRDDVAIYWERFHAMWPVDAGGSTNVAQPWDELSIRFASHAPGVSSALVGSRDAAHLARAAAHVARGPLEGERLSDLSNRFERHGRDWAGVV